jgi:ankyrin repeat protein
MADVSIVDCIDRLKESFLCVAAQQGNTQDCEALINIGADVNWRNSDGDSPLIAACRRGHTETVALLLERNASVNISGRDKNSALHVAVLRGDEATVDLLMHVNAVCAECQWTDCTGYCKFERPSYYLCSTDAK